MAYHVLVYSKSTGTEGFLCADADEAVIRLGELARQAETARQHDGNQRYFCIVMDTQPPEVTIPAPTVAIYVKGGTIHWIGGNVTDLRAFILDGDSEATSSIACWEETPRLLSELDASLQSVLRAHGADCLFDNADLPSSSCLETGTLTAREERA